MEYYAHSANANGNRHALHDHLSSVARQAALFASPFGASQMGAYAGWYHDLGKYDPAFQQYLLQSERDPAFQGHGPDHKGVGAILAVKMQLELLAFVIAGHHGGLPSRASLKLWLKERSKDAQVQEVLTEALHQQPELQRIRDPALLLPTHLRTPSEGELYVRLLFSALVDADFLDTEQHFNPTASSQRSATPLIADLWEIFERYQQQQQATIALTPVNMIRQQVYQHCLDGAPLPPGFFRLTVPTGGGKTRSSLAFALRHALQHDLHRIIYAIPYLSITEQTADIFRSIFSTPQAVLEHHSGITVPEDPNSATLEQCWQRLAAENWDAPIIVTTIVQLFESLLARTPSACRKLHNIAKSVIILDEAQMVPTHLLDTILDVLQQLVQHYGVTVVLCTATQPALDQRVGFPGLEGIREIIPDPAQLFQMLQRVKYQWPRPGERWSWQQVATRIREVPQALVIVNTRADAVHVVQAASAINPLHLSTSMCGAHRRVVLQEVRRRLFAGEACHVISTQLIEAGVDLDFPLVLRALGPFDSIAQAAGRCNREGKLARGTVVVFDPLEGTLPPGSYRTGTMLTQALLKQGLIDHSDPATYQHYYERYYALVDRDEPRVQEVRRQFDYPSVAERFQIIEENTPVVVRYGHSSNPTHVAHLLSRLQQEPTQRRSLLRQLQQYMVTLRSKEIDWARTHDCLEEIAPGLLLWTGIYDPLYGLVLKKSYAV